VSAATDLNRPDRDFRNYSYLWRDGALVEWEHATTHVSSIGHASISAVFEGIKAYWHEQDEQLYVFRMAEHYKRLRESAKVAGLLMPYSVEAWCAATRDLLRSNNVRSDVYIRPWLSLKGIVRETFASPEFPTEAVIDSWPVTSQLLTDRSCRAAITSWTRIDDNSMPPRVKAFSNYHSARLAVNEVRRKGSDWPIFLNARGKVAEGPASCILLVRNGTVVTPAISSGLLESITRDTILRLLKERFQLPVVEREVDRTELYVADELFFIGTAWEVLPISEVDSLAVADRCIGPITQEVARAYHDLVRGIDKNHSDWRTSIY
jgi:branched-chain amino acid aminotransferase